jgi:hypothetical protein
MGRDIPLSFMPSRVLITVKIVVPATIYFCAVMLKSMH